MEKLETRNMLPVGTLLRNGAYRVERQLSSGGFGNTYLVLNVAFNERYAMKEFFMKGVNTRNGTDVTVSVADNHATFDGQKAKFEKEAVRLRNLDNPHIPKVHDLFTDNSTVYYVMDYVDGESVAQLLERTGMPMSEEQSWQVLKQVLDALQTVHAQDIWHLDIKPGNIMLDKSGRVFLIDFGASKQVSSSGSQTSTALCYTKGFAPLEQVEQDMDKFGPWTDFYALGATLYNMQTRKDPPSSSGILSYKEACKASSSPSDIRESDPFQFPDTMSDNMKQLIRWLMQPNRKDRPRSVDDILHGVPMPASTAAGGDVLPVGSTTDDNQETEEDGQSTVLSGEEGGQSTVLSGEEDGQSTVLSDGETSAGESEPEKEDNGDKPKRSVLPKVLLALAVVAVLGVGAWLLFFNKSPEQRAAEDQQQAYEQAVEHFKEIVENAENFVDLKEADDLLSDIVDMEEIHSRALPDVYNQRGSLRRMLRKAEQKERDEYMELAVRLMGMDEYKQAFDLLNEAYTMMSNDDKLAALRLEAADGIGYMDVSDVEYANCEYDGTDIDEVGSTLYADRMHLIWPRVVYNSLLPEDSEVEEVDLYYKIIRPDGTMCFSSDSPRGYTNHWAIGVAVGEVDQREWLQGWGGSDHSVFEKGEYQFKLYCKGHLIYEETFTLR